MSRGLVAAGVGLGAVATLVAAVQAPLWTYVVSLALFGLPHVLTELRYVDHRFAARCDRRTTIALATLLAGIVGLRAAGVAGLGPASWRTNGELLLGALLVAAVLAPLTRTRATPWALLTLLLVVTGLVSAPYDTLVVLAVLHNLTPLGFLAERLRGRDRHRALALGLAAFVLVPLLIASGAVRDGLAAWLPWRDDGPFGSGTLDLHLPVFVLPALLGSDAALDVFSAAVWLQCAHYAAVLHVLPRLGGGSEAAHARLPWTTPRLRLAQLAACAAMTAGFAAGFMPARAVYGVAAALHAWLEIPLLLLACGIGPVHVPAPARAA